MEDPDLKSQLIEGISNNVLIVSVIIIGVVFYLCYIFYRNSIRSFFWRPPNIHPDSQENINSTRAQIIPRPRQHDPELSCPVCLGQITYGVETNCGHLFCGQCIITYWKTGRWLGAVACPICRQTVRVMILAFTNPELSEENSEAKNAILDEIYGYNRRFSGQARTVSEYLQDMPTLLRHALADLFSVHGMAMMFRIRIVLCFFLALIYLISPFDIISEMAVGIFGYFDDLFIIVIVAVHISSIYQAYLSSQAEQHSRMA